MVNGVIMVLRLNKESGRQCDREKRQRKWHVKQNPKAHAKHVRRLEPTREIGFAGRRTICREKCGRKFRPRRAGRRSPRVSAKRFLVSAIADIRSRRWPSPCRWITPTLTSPKPTSRAHSL